jgi:hypothetical protein
MMYSTIKGTAQRVHNSFRSSATIVFARAQLVFACAWTVLIATDLAPIIQNPKWITAWLICSGLITEYCRRRPATLDPLPPVATLQPTQGPLK